MQKMYNWTAKRSGKGLTIFGSFIPGGERQRVTDVHQIEGSAGQPTIATARDGTQYVLV